MNAANCAAKLAKNAPELEKSREAVLEIEELEDIPTQAKPKSSGYSMDHDDLNPNPFETKKSLSNVEVSPQNLTKTISKSDLNDDFHSVTDIDAYALGLEKLISKMKDSFKKGQIASQAVIARQGIEIEQLREDISTVEQSSADALQRHMRVKEKFMLQAKVEENLRKKNEDNEARHQYDNDQFDALVVRSNILVAKANVEIEKLEQETTLRLRLLEAENKKTKLELTSAEEKNAQAEQEKAELIKLYDDIVNCPSRNPV